MIDNNYINKDRLNNKNFKDIKFIDGINNINFGANDDNIELSNNDQQARCIFIIVRDGIYNSVADYNSTWRVSCVCVSVCVCVCPGANFATG